MRTCDGCGSRLPPFFPRKRSGDQLLCKSCEHRKANTMSTAGEKKISGFLDWYRVLVLDRGERVVITVWDGTDPAEAMTKALAEQADPDSIHVYIERNDGIIWSDGEMKVASKQAGTDTMADTFYMNLDIANDKDGCTICGDSGHNTDEHEAFPEKFDDINRRGRRTASDPYSELGSSARDMQDEYRARGRALLPSAKTDEDLNKAIANLREIVDGPRATDNSRARLDSLLKEKSRHQGSRRIAHDSGDSETLFHCPFCGAGQLIGRSDGTAECSMCDTCFTVQVQPKHPEMPQTIDGVPYDNPDMPGTPQVGLPPEQIPGEETPLPNEQAANGIFASRYYLTSEGVALDEESYLRHLAIKHADDRSGVIEAVRAERQAKP